MPERTVYSLGIDLGQTPSPTAVARGDAVELMGPMVDIAATIEQLIASDGIRPSAVVLAGQPDQRVGHEELGAEIANRLGLGTDRVWVIDHSEATALGMKHLLQVMSDGAATGPDDDRASSAAAIGAALSGVPSDDERRKGVGLLAAGAGGAVAGALGAATLAGAASAPAVAGGPMGVPLAHAGPQGVPLGATAGPAGVPLPQGVVGPAGVPLPQGVVGPAGVPLPHGVEGPVGVPIGGSATSGPTGVPLSSNVGAGPPGVPIDAPVKVTRRGRTALIVGAAAAAIAVGVGVGASSGDDSTTATPTTTASVATAVAPVISLADTTLPPADTTTSVVVAVTVSTAVPTSVPTTVLTELVGASCAVGSWVADNESFGSVFAGFAAAGGGAIELGEIVGAIHVDVASDGTVVTTFDNWKMTATIPGQGTAEISETGVETNTVTFADDGSYTVTATEIGSAQRVSFDGVVFMDGPSPEAVFHGASTFSCAADRLDITIPGQLGDWVAIFTREG